MAGALIYVVPSDSDGILEELIGLQGRFGGNAMRCSTGQYRDHRRQQDNGKPGALHVKCAAAGGLQLLFPNADLTRHAFVCA